MSLPLPLVDSLFARMLVRYGAAWTRMWEGVDINAVKADWADVLGGYATRPEAIKHGLEHLPADRPPNVTQFALLCRGCPTKLLPLLAVLQPTDEDKTRVRSLLQQARDRITGAA